MKTVVMRDLNVLKESTAGRSRKELCCSHSPCSWALAEAAAVGIAPAPLFSIQTVFPGLLYALPTAHSPAAGASVCTDGLWKLKPARKQPVQWAPAACALLDPAPLQQLPQPILAGFPVAIQPELGSWSCKLPPSNLPLTL